MRNNFQKSRRKETYHDAKQNRSNIACNRRTFVEDGKPDERVRGIPFLPHPRTKKRKESNKKRHECSCTSPREINPTPSDGYECTRHASGEENTAYPIDLSSQFFE
jgi:hypothetical protein